jgi:hypothetical protein
MKRLFYQLDCFLAQGCTHEHHHHHTQSGVYRIRHCRNPTEACLERLASQLSFVRRVYWNHNPKSPNNKRLFYPLDCFLAQGVLTNITIIIVNAVFTGFVIVEHDNPRIVLATMANSGPHTNGSQEWDVVKKIESYGSKSGKTSKPILSLARRVYWSNNSKESK